MKPKLKPILTKSLAITGALITSLTLSTVALADDFYGNNKGTTGSLGSPEGYMYASSTINSWKVSLYVATTDDGKIDPAEANIATGKGLARVGTIIYDNITKNSAADDAIFFPIRLTDDKRYTAQSTLNSLTESSAVGNPEVSQVNKLFDYLPGSDLARIGNGDYIYRYDGAVVSKWLPVYGAYNNNANNDHEFTQTVIEQMNNALGGKSDNFTDLYAKVISCGLGSEPKAKLAESKAKLGQTDLDLLLPTNPDCVVEWCCVIEPMVDTYINAATSRLGLINVCMYEGNYVHNYLLAPQFVCGDSGTVRFSFDAYTFARYNQASKSFYAGESRLKDITKVIKDFKDYKRLSGWKNTGALLTELGKNYCNTTVARCTNVYQPDKVYCGIPSYQANPISFDISNNPGYFAAYGGVGVLTTTIEDNTEVPVYYHIYNYQPGSINPTISCLEGTPADPSKGTFTADKSYGDVVSLGYSTKETDYTQPTGALSYYPGKVYPVVLSKQNPTTYDPKNKTPLVDPTITLDPKNPPKEIHVKVVVSSGPPVYYHKYTYNPDSEDPPTYVGTFPDYTLKPDATSFTPTDKYGKPVAMLIPKLSVGAVQGYPSDVPTHYSAGSTEAPFASLAGTKITFIHPYANPSEIHVMTVVEASAPAAPTGTDRIKSYDLTQFIDDTQNAIIGSEHLGELSSYKQNDYNGYNTKYMPDANTYSKTDRAWITSNYLAGKVNSHYESSRHKVSATNYAGPDGTRCSITHAAKWIGYRDNAHTHSPSCYPDGDTTKSPNCGRTEHKHSSSCDIYCTGGSFGTHYNCHYTEEFVTAKFGFSPNNTQYTTTQGGRIKTGNLSGTYTTVGFTIPKAYYSYAEMVKLAGQHLYTAGKQYFLPTREQPIKNGIEANKLATFDLLLKDNANYWIRYLAGVNTVGEDDFVQYTRFSDDDKRADVDSSIGDGKFDYTSGAGTDINGVQFIAHRDMLSGDNIASSLAVSGYMAKYAQNSDTFNYLKLMKDAGFTFTGISNIKDIADKTGTTDYRYVDSEINAISHNLRTVDIANATTSASDLKASEEGKQANEYNTNYTKGSDDKYKVRFGLGGLTADGGNIYTHIDQEQLKNAALDTNSHKGDALRSIWYYANIGVSREKAPGCDHWDSVTHSCHGYSCNKNHTVHKSSECLDSLTSVSNNNLAATGQDIYLPNGSYKDDPKNLYGTYVQQKDMITSIETSRLSFLVDLAVEGTTAGEYATATRPGITFGADKKDSLVIINSKGYLTYVPSSSTGLSAKQNQELKSYEEATFEIKQADYANVGKETEIKDKDKSEKTVLAEYRYTLPTRNYVFNPSYYMVFDDDFEDVNKSVWMLSEQTRMINFKNILSIVLTQDMESDSDLVDNSNQSGYSTSVSSEWSTDKDDIDFQDETGLPVAKAGNGYAANVSASGGTITFYIVLQDPEFTGNPNDLQNNQSILNDYAAEMQEILKQMNATATTGLADTTNRKAKTHQAGFAMFTNMVNGSSVNSGLRVATSKSSVAQLPDKEPMQFSTHATMTADLFTSDKAYGTYVTGGDIEWVFYALEGNKVKNAFNGSKDDISDTTSNRNRKFLGTTVTSMNDAKGLGVKTTLNELNNRLTGLMANQSDKVTIPKDTKPYKNSGGDFSWYTEDYEGFIVAVCQIEFTFSDEREDSKKTNKNDEVAFTTEMSSIYRGESDWKQDHNALAAPLEYDYEIAGVNNYITSGKNPFLLKGTKLTLITKDGLDTLKGNNLVDKAGNPLIYGIGLELTNIPIKFGSTTESAGNDNGKPYTNIIGNDDSHVSFFYQPTYFNIRGSVYDTAG